MIRARLFFRTGFALGIGNVFRVLQYRLGLKTGLSRACRVKYSMVKGPFFKKSEKALAASNVQTALCEEIKLFGWKKLSLEQAPPCWHTNALTGLKSQQANTPWWMLPDFDSDIGDIKGIWELSRLNWVIRLAQQAKGGKPRSLIQLNAWLEDWCEQNPPFCGVNWKCGQEAAIRVMHVLVALLILEQLDRPVKGLLAFIEMHLMRIEPSIHYARAQDNNHGTSEAAALFIGGALLHARGVAKGSRWQRLGRRMLEERVERLIGAQGGFSQYSVNYHRLLLDTLSFVEVFRVHLNLSPLSNIWDDKARLATKWLYSICEETRGDYPNVGANDGACLLPLTESCFEDCRISVHLATALFCNKLAYPELSDGDKKLNWLGVSRPTEVVERPQDFLSDDIGFVALRQPQVLALMRYPRFKYRPSQSDLLHVDLWIHGVNILRDAGTYSYAAESKWRRYFDGVEGHNTIQFDKKEQMPRFGRFLFGDWLKTTVFRGIRKKGSSTSCLAGYRSRSGASHNRQLILSGKSLLVLDNVVGFNTAVLRWRLSPNNWSLSRAGDLLVVSSEFEGNAVTLEVRGDRPISRAELVDGWESKLYSKKEKIPVLEVEFLGPGNIITEVKWSK